MTWLYQDYIKNIGTFLCPNTRHSIDLGDVVYKPNGAPVPRHLVFLARKQLDKGHSYEVFGRFGGGGPKKTTATIATYTLQRYTPEIGQSLSPSENFLMFDGDSATATNDVGNFPDFPEDNHGAEGGHMNFCDGHAAWVPQARWKQAWNKSQDYAP